MMRRGVVFEITPKIIEQIEDLASLQSTHQEIAAALGCSHDTFENRRADTPEVEAALWRGRQLGKLKLRKLLIARAVYDQSPSTAIFLSKQPPWLGFSDRASEEESPLVEILTRLFGESKKVADANLGMEPPKSDS